MSLTRICLIDLQGESSGHSECRVNFYRECGVDKTKVDWYSNPLMRA